MKEPYILNPYERAALLALSQNDLVSTQSIAQRNFGRRHLETLVQLGLAAPSASNTANRQGDFKITDAGWRCMYGLTKPQIDSQTERKPVPFRIWQWPLPAALKKAA